MRDRKEGRERGSERGMEWGEDVKGRKEIRDGWTEGGEKEIQVDWGTWRPVTGMQLSLVQQVQ